MRSVRIAAGEVRVGDTLLSVGSRTINARVLEVKETHAGQRIVGPRGGQYELTRHGSADRIVLVTAQARPVVTRKTAVTVLRDEEAGA